MTDNEIVRALECCGENLCGQGCPRMYYCDTAIECKKELMEDALALINRQKAEIERYEKTVGKLAINKDGIVIGTLNGKETEYIQKSVAEVFRNMAVNRAKTEAVKEFAEMLKERVEGCFYDLSNFDDFACALTDIDNLVKEFTEGGDGG